jgi:hypothetical protein
MQSRSFGVCGTTAAVAIATPSGCFALIWLSGLLLCSVHDMQQHNAERVAVYLTYQSPVEGWSAACGSMQLAYYGCRSCLFDWSSARIVACKPYGWCGSLGFIAAGVIRNGTCMYINSAQPIQLSCRVSSLLYARDHVPLLLVLHMIIVQFLGSSAWIDVL